MKTGRYLISIIAMNIENGGSEFRDKPHHVRASSLGKSTKDKGKSTKDKALVFNRLEQRRRALNRKFGLTAARESSSVAKLIKWVEKMPGGTEFTFSRSSIMHASLSMRTNGEALTTELSHAIAKYLPPIQMELIQLEIDSPEAIVDDFDELPPTVTMCDLLLDLARDVDVETWKEVRSYINDRQLHQIDQKFLCHEFEQGRELMKYLLNHEVLSDDSKQICIAVGLVYNNGKGSVFDCIKKLQEVSREKNDLERCVQQCTSPLRKSPTQIKCS